MIKTDPGDLVWIVAGQIFEDPTGADVSDFEFRWPSTLFWSQSTIRGGGGHAFYLVNPALQRFHAPARGDELGGRPSFCMSRVCVNHLRPAQRSHMRSRSTRPSGSRRTSTCSP